MNVPEFDFDDDSFTTILNPTSTSITLDLNIEEEEIYWANVAKFDFDEESFTSVFNSVCRPSTPATTNTLDLEIRVEEKYWSNFANFDFDDESFTSVFNSACRQGSPSQSFSAKNTRPSTPASGPSTTFHNNTSQSLAVQPSPTPSKKKYYAVTKGRFIGVFDNW